MPGSPVCRKDDGIVRKPAAGFTLSRVCGGPKAVRGHRITDLDAWAADTLVAAPKCFVPAHLSFAAGSVETCPLRGKKDEGCTGTSSC